MERGYLKLWRRSLDSEIFHNPELWRLWTWCLMRTSYKQRFLPFHTGKNKISVKVGAGQFIFGRNKAAEFLGDSPSTIWKRMKKLESLENIKIESNRQYSIVTICNWEEYQEPDEQEVTAEEQLSDNQVTTKEQRGDNEVTTEEQLSDTNKKVKKVKKVKEVKDIYGTFKNVLLSEKEVEKLKEKFNGTLDAKIEELSEGIASKGYKYKSHYATILSWDRKKKREAGEKTANDTHNGFDQRDYQEGASSDEQINAFLNN